VSHPDSPGIIQQRHEQDGFLGGKVNRSVIVRVFDTKQIVEEALLSEEVLVVRIVTVIGLSCNFESETKTTANKK
jgi:hypothetical protein